MRFGQFRIKQQEEDISMLVAKFLSMEDKYYFFCSCSGSEKQVMLVGSFLTHRWLKIISKSPEFCQKIGDDSGCDVVSEKMLKTSNVQLENNWIVFLH